MSAGAPVIAYDVPAIRAAGLSSVVPVVVLERSADEVTVVGAEGAEILPGARLLSV